MKGRRSEEFFKKKKKSFNSTRIIGRTSFELRLVVIGILITVYWQLLPELTQPTTVAGYDLRFALLKISYVLSGLVWFATLLTGTVSLAYDQKEFKKTFDRLFKFSNWYSLWVLSTIVFLYVLTFIYPILVNLLG